MKRHISNEVLCPFYHSEDKYRVCCEGVVRDSTVHVVFASSLAKTRYSRRYCCDRHRDCRVAKMLQEKYGE